MANITSAQVRCHCDHYIVLKQGVNSPNIRIDNWQHGLNMYHWCEGEWKPKRFAPELILLSQDKTLSPGGPLWEFISQVPSQLVPIIERFQWHQYSVMRLLNRRHLALHMAKYNPVLLGLLCCQWSKCPSWSDKEIDGLLLLKRSEILERITGIKEKWVVRLLSKLDFPILGESDLSIIRKLIKNPEVLIYLRRFKSITPSMLKLALWAASYLECRLLQEVCHDPSMAERALKVVAYMARDTVMMGEKTYEPDINELVMSCRTIRELQRLHESILADYEIMSHAGVAALFGTGDFMEPPIPGNETIVPICTVGDLIKEGKEMNHCVAAYSGLVRKKELYIYKVLSPQRSTLSIVKPYYNPQIGELALAGNKTPAVETWVAVQNWLSSSLAA